jgi:Meiotically up-regulated gene 113
MLTFQWVCAGASGKEVSVDATGFLDELGLEKVAPEDPSFAASKDQLVYFLQGENGGPIKIGRSHRAALRDRISSIQTGYPYKLVLRCVVRGGNWEENEIHERFAWCRLSGEWFQPVSELAGSIGALVVPKQHEVDLVRARDEGKLEAHAEAEDQYFKVTARAQRALGESLAIYLLCDYPETLGGFLDRIAEDSPHEIENALERVGRRAA